MTTISRLAGWKVTSKIVPSKRKLMVKIHFRYIDLKKIRHLTPAERIKAIDRHYQTQLQQFLAAIPPGKYIVSGTLKRPTGVEAVIFLSELARIQKNACVKSVSIEKIQGARKIRPKKEPRFFCVKMTVSIEVEGVTKGMQDYEERYVLIKAISPEEAYKKVKSQARDYAEPYLNNKGQMVRWRVESYDHCYDTDIISSDEFNRSEGIEVYSVVKSRRLIKERVWAGQ